MMSQTTTPPPKVSFVVTGFGPFRGVKDNPTTKLAKAIVEYIKSNNIPVEISGAYVIETAAESVVKKLDILSEECVNSINNGGAVEDQPIVVVSVHLGVNYRGEKFQLECCAYNDATFRIPDELGFQPKRQCIVKRESFDACFRTDLDMDLLIGDLNTGGEKKWDKRVCLSTDPGRFVCNYTYFYSLEKCRAINSSLKSTGTSPISKAVSLFIHVPPLRVESEEEQLSFLSSALIAIQKQLCR
mmetsp:Transcript_4635/g.6785  ORF Transcript_4635/g.6785 Transcript_4635/m.6785 type:complete len:243 (-) Transcript_4635:87-815(-)